jgi:hypothetical protein
MEKSTSAGTLRTSAWGGRISRSYRLINGFPASPMLIPQLHAVLAIHTQDDRPVSAIARMMLPYERLLRPDRLHPGRRADAGQAGIGGGCS